MINKNMTTSNALLQAHLALADNSAPKVPNKLFLNANPRTASTMVLKGIKQVTSSIGSPTNPNALLLGNRRYNEFNENLELLKEAQENRKAERMGQKNQPTGVL